MHRSFSFDRHDEAFNAPQERDDGRLQPFSPYRDSPNRPSSISPPPSYSSPPPLDEPVSPIQQHISTRSHYHQPAQSDALWVPSEPQHNHTRSDDSARPILTGDSSPPRPPPHRRQQLLAREEEEEEQEHRDRYRNGEVGYSYPPRTMSEITPDGDNFSQQAQGGGLDRVAWNIAHQNQRESGVEAVRAIEGSGRPQGSSGSDTLYSATRPDGLRNTHTGSYSSNLPLAVGAATPGAGTPYLYPSNPNYSGNSIPLDQYPMHPVITSPYHDSPYLHSSRSYQDPISQATINPYNIADDGDDGFIPEPKKKSMMDMARQTSRDMLPAAGAAATGSGVMRSLSGMMSRKNNEQSTNRDYGPVTSTNTVGNDSDPTVGGGDGGREKSEWLARQTKGNNKMRWILFVVIGGVILVAIIGGVIGGVVASKNHKSSDSPSGNSTSSAAAGSSNDAANNAATDTAVNGDLNKDSSQIKALMNNPDLHKVFPAIDYTPWGTQYPLCHTYPPSQNNVTRDMAVLSQLTNAVRLYGTDCNQTEMVLHAIDRLGLTDMKVWLGVWIDETNQTTNNRQLAQMYEILKDVKDTSIFGGAIIGNEALFRAGADKAETEQELIDIITKVKSNFTTLGYDIPVATSDLGDNWNAQIVSAVDMVMANIHPFFAGVTAANAASWTWTFWQNNDAPLTKVAGQTNKKQIISETGWPSAGGNDCGSDAAGNALPCATKTAGSVAGIDEMNTFMEGWVCQALANGTEYFWFEAFDEPWKVVYNTPGRAWEDKWGLMDSGRNLKPGLQIPDCGGKTVS